MTYRKDELERKIRAEPRAVLVVNTTSRRGERLFAHARQALASNGIPLDAAFPVESPLQLRPTVHAAIERGARLIIVGGGDGTISAIVDELAHRDLVLGLLPLGTGNSFARSLSIPLDLPGAIDVIARGKVVDIDLGQVEGDYFANVIDLGMSAAMALATSRRLKRVFGKFAYVLVGASLLVSHRPFRCRIRTDQGTQEFTTHEVIIANGRFYGDTVLAEEATVDDRRLLVFTMHALSRWRLLRLWIAFLRGRHEKLMEVSHLSAREVWLDTDPPQCINIDGEAAVSTPAHVTLAPQALHVLAPRQFEDR